MLAQFRNLDGTFVVEISGELEHDRLHKTTNRVKTTECCGNHRDESRNSGVFLQEGSSRATSPLG